VAKTPVRKSNNSQFIGLIVVIAVIGVAGLGYLVTNKSSAKAVIVDPTIKPGAADGYLMGKADAPVQIMEFGDFECPGCGQFAAVTEPDVRERLVKTGQVSFRFFDFPLTEIHRNTWAAHLAAGCSDAQGKFWEMHDRIYGSQDRWNGQATSSPIGIFKDFAKEIGLDVAAWQKCIDDQAPAARIKGNRAEGERRGVSGTPTFVIGDRMLPAGPAGFDQIKAYVDSAAARATAAKTGTK
jgi:protein-disulfide isomerase